MASIEFVIGRIAGIISERVPITDNDGKLFVEYGSDLCQKIAQGLQYAGLLKGEHTDFVNLTYKDDGKPLRIRKSLIEYYAEHYNEDRPRETFTNISVASREGMGKGKFFKVRESVADLDRMLAP